MLFSFLLRVVFFSVVSVNLPENPEEYALKHLNRSARFARCARSLAALADGMLFFLWRRVVSCGFGEAPKILEKSTSKLPKSSPKPSQIHPKTDQNPPQKALKARSGIDCASDRFCASFFLGSGRLYCTVQYCTMLYSTVQYCRGLQDTPSSINPPKVEPLRSKMPSTSIGKIV